jgi:23S rRNA (cytosine1962-C5)-methyltransferase
MGEPTVIVTKRGEERVASGHPWIYRSDIAKEDAAPGAIVRVAGPKGRPLGFAFYSSTSEIRLRMIERRRALQESFLADRIAAAVTWRERIAEGADACRLVHGEADGIPSLIVDRYGDVLVMQTLSQATEHLKPQIIDILVRTLHPKGIVERNDPKVRQLEGLERAVELVWGEVPDTLVVSEGTVKLNVDVRQGQKTGLFLDQRENHLATRNYARGRVLDAFCYDGGFALQAAQVSEEVTAVDISAAPLGRLQANAELNGLTIRTQEANAFDLLHELDTQSEQFDTVILDPPAFAKNKQSIPKAARGYKEINLRALKILRPGGILITCSCSYHIHEADFEALLESAARDACVAVSVIEKRRQARDHPVLLAVPETYYLKCLILRRL